MGFHCTEGNIVVWGIAVLDNFWYFGNFNLELRYCGILQTCGMQFFGILENSPSNPPKFSEPFPVSDRFISC